MAKFTVLLNTIPAAPTIIEEKRGIARIAFTNSVLTAAVIAENHLMAAIRAVTYIKNVDRDKIILVRKGEKGQPHRFRISPVTGDVVQLDSPFYEGGV